MTSNINAGAIVTNYPTPGQDNNTQGFRDNFTAIQAGLATAKSEITALQSNAVLTVDLATSTTPVVNNLLGATLSNALFSQFNGVVATPVTASSSTYTCSLNAGPVHQYTCSGNPTISITGWKSGVWCVLRLMLIGDGGATRTVQITSTSSGSQPSTIRTATGWSGSHTTTTATLSLDTTPHYEMVEAWSVDGGANVFIKNIGEY